MTSLRHPDQDLLDRVRELTDLLAQPNPPPLDHDSWWAERAILLEDLEGQRLWHPVCLAAELGITLGLLCEWEII